MQSSVDTDLSRVDCTVQLFGQKSRAPEELVEHTAGAAEVSGDLQARVRVPPGGRGTPVITISQTPTGEPKRKSRTDRLTDSTHTRVSRPTKINYDVGRIQAQYLN